jgi:hypothetical protein
MEACDTEQAALDGHALWPRFTDSVTQNGTVNAEQVRVLMNHHCQRQVATETALAHERLLGKGQAGAQT